MEHVRLGMTGVSVSRICLGCMTYGAKSWREWVLEEEALKALEVVLDDEERKALEEPYVPHPVLGHE